MKTHSIIAANWKMNKTPSEGVKFFNKLNTILADVKDLTIIFGLPFTGLNSFSVEPPFFKAAQNCHWQDVGAFTGEISVPMIKDCGAKYVIVGHSERRCLFNEKDGEINLKIKSTLECRLKPILCIGETFEERKNNQTNNILEHQIKKALSNIDNIDDIIIAYEPVWAIGSGLSANEEQIKEAHLKIKDILLGLYHNSKDIPILYGGSVKPNNAKKLIGVTGVSGFLIGGASLDIDSFTSIINNTKII